MVEFHGFLLDHQAENAGISKVFVDHLAENAGTFVNHQRNRMERYGRVKICLPDASAIRITKLAGPCFGLMNGPTRQQKIVGSTAC